MIDDRRTCCCGICYFDKNTSLMCENHAECLLTMSSDSEFKVYLKYSDCITANIHPMMLIFCEKGTFIKWTGCCDFEGIP
jgi:hypothetical protein